MPAMAGWGGGVVEEGLEMVQDHWSMGVMWATGRGGPCSVNASPWKSEDIPCPSGSAERC